MTVYAAYPWRTNAELIAYGVVPLGYLRKEWDVLDPTYGQGSWWKLWRPDRLEAHDKYTVDGMDFANLPREWKRRFDAVAYDPPYKLNGRSTPGVDARYGVEGYVSVADRKTQMIDGLVSCYYVLALGGTLLVKCQDQVCGGKVHWQTDWMTYAATSLGMAKIDRFDMVGRSRPQPARTRKDGKPSRQEHARRNGSTLLVFEKPRPPRRRKKAA